VLLRPKNILFICQIIIAVYATKMAKYVERQKVSSVSFLSCSAENGANDNQDYLYWF
jgi:hypothetical protein